MSRQSKSLFVLGTLLYFFIYWRRLYFDGWIPFDGDMLRLVYPSWAIGKNLLRMGAGLLWDPYRNMGQPYLASPPNQALYPLQWIAPLVSFLQYNQIFIAVHTLLMATFSYLLARRWKMDFLSGVFIAFAVAFNGGIFSKATVHCDLASLSWIPASITFLECGQPGFLGLSLALQWFAGLPSFSILTIATLLVFSATNTAFQKNLICLGKACVFGAGIAAVQAVPFLEFLKESTRLKIGAC